MSITLPTSLVIDAPREIVWAVLTDFRRYGEWSNFAGIDGAAEEGTKLSIRIPGMSFRATVTAAVENTQLQWAANIISDKLFLGQHTFTLESTPDGSTLLTNSELFAGILVKPFERMFATTDRPNGYDAFNRALKTRVESVAAAGHRLALAIAPTR